MNKPQPSILKTCSICGQQKPLSAFLQLAGSGGASYSNVCADCRLAGLDKIKNKEMDDSTRTSTTVTVDNKSRVEGEADKRQERQAEEEQYHEERDEKESVELEKEEKTEHKLKDERKHRNSFLQKNTFLTTPKKPEDKATPAAKQVIERAIQQAHGVEQTSRKEQAAKSEQKEKEIDYSVGPFIDTQIAGKEKYTKGITSKEGIVAKEGILSKNKSSFGQFATWAKSTPEFSNQSIAKGGNKPDEKIISEFIEQSTKPGSRKK